VVGEAVQSEVELSREHLRNRNHPVTIVINRL